MNIETAYFGEVTIDQSKIIKFENGIPGFHEEKQFVLIDIDGNPMFQVLQSIQNHELGFIVTDPFILYKDYEFKLDDNDIEQLQIEAKEDLMIRSIITVQSPFEKSTINLKAPIIINQKLRLAKQIVITEDQYTTKHPIQPKKGGE